MAIFEWTCAHCDRVQTAGEDNSQQHHTHINIGLPKEGYLGCTYLAIRCLNSQCGKASFKFHIHTDFINNGYWKSDLTQVIFAEWLIPRGTSKPQPDYIPAPIRSDYEEACLIRNLSPKASATLSRRCIQGMIRDFAGISKSSLDAEIRSLQSALDDGSAPRSLDIR